MSQPESQFTYHKAEITTPRSGDLIIDVRSMIYELVFFESLDKPYLTGQVAIMDDKGLFNAIRFSGTEKLVLQMKTESAYSRNEFIMDRQFIMTSIESITKASNSGNSSIYIFNLIDEYAFVSKTKQVSRAVRDNLITEVQKLCSNELGLNIDQSYLDGIESVQSNFKGVIPYMHPLEAASWLTQKATTQSGMPFFLYASIHDTNTVRVGSLESFLTKNAWNEDIPFIFSPSNTQAAEESGDPSLQAFQVQAMKATKLQDTMKQMMHGGVGSLYTITDMSNGQTTAQHFSIERMLVRASVDALIDITKQNIYDNQYRTPVNDTVNIGGDALHDVDAEIYHNVVSRGVYGDKKSLHDEVSPSMFLKKIEGAAYRNAIYKNMMDVTLPGPGFIASGGSVGDKIRIHVLNDNTETESPDKLDSLRSGDFLVYNSRHTFRDTRHDVALTVFKLERGPSE